MNPTPEIITDPSLITVYEAREVQRFHIALRRSGNGLTIKLTDGSARKVRNAVEKAGKGSFYEFDYETKEAIIMVSKDVGTLKDWMDQDL